VLIMKYWGWEDSLFIGCIVGLIIYHIILGN
jgi:hypothetical protein